MVPWLRNRGHWYPNWHLKGLRPVEVQHRVLCAYSAQMTYLVQEEVLRSKVTMGGLQVLIYSLSLTIGLSWKPEDRLTVAQIRPVMKSTKMCDHGILGMGKG